MKQLFLFFASVILLASSCKTTPHARYDIIPLPAQLTEKEGEFSLKNGIPLYVSLQNEELKSIVELFAGQVRTASGIKLDIQDLPNDLPESGIIFQSVNLPDLGMEGYSLSIDKKKALVQANTANGFFYAVQTMFQLLPPEIYSAKKESANWTMACVDITDIPRLPYRGMHLDVCRHIFSVEFVKKYIDLLAVHKLNRFHWHLTDDQGWRIEIKKYPELQEIAAWRDGTLIGHPRDTMNCYDTIHYGGYFTQEQIKEVVAYAASKYIEVIPEIEMPGHASAALAAYPHLGCVKDTVYKVVGDWGVFDDVFCTTDEVFTFLENVLVEVMELFPSKYIHIGGDECPKVRWKKCPHCQAMIKKYKLKDEHELQSYFVQRMEKFVNAHGKKIIGWDEILEGGLAPNATVMSWRGEEGGIEAAMQNHDVIMVPRHYLYFDYYQAEDKTTEPLAIGGFVPLEKVYSLNPVPEVLPADKQVHIIGVQANLWTEYIADTAHVQYMVYPRASALSEIAWSANKSKNFAVFCNRLQTQFKRYDYLNVNYAKHYLGKNCTYSAINP
jgi:hexosaminidase